MFNKPRNEANNPGQPASPEYNSAIEKKSTISQKTKIVGNYSSDDPIVIEGVIEGKVSVKNVVVLGKTGIIKGNLKVQSIQIFGKIIGDVTATGKVTLERSGFIEGNIVSPKLAISEGAVFLPCNPLIGLVFR